MVKLHRGNLIKLENDGDWVAIFKVEDTGCTEYTATVKVVCSTGYRRFNVVWDDLPPISPELLNVTKADLIQQTVVAIAQRELLEISK